MPPRKRLGQLLTELKIVDEHQLQSALGHQKQWGGKLGAILVQKGFCREDQVVAALSQHLNMPLVRIPDVKVDPRAVKMVSRAVAERLHVFAYEVSGSGRSEVITIAMSDPTDLSAVDQLAFHTGKRIKPMLAGDTEVLAAIQKYYAPEKPAEGAQAQPQPPVPAGLRPFVDGQKAPGAAAKPTPISPMPSVAAATVTATKLSPVAGRTPTPLAVAPVPPPPPPPAPVEAVPEPPAEPLDLEGGDLPADAPMDGLEPIAAYSQGGTNVDGGEGIPSDAAAASSDEPVPLEDPSALQGWAEGTQEGVPLETPAAQGAARSTPGAAGTAWGQPTATPIPTSMADELPIDAIMGTADVLEHAEAAPASADAPDAWSDISDPLAAQPEAGGVEGASDSEAVPAEASAETAEEAPADSGPEWEAAAAAIEAAANESYDPQEIEVPDDSPGAEQSGDPGAAEAEPEVSFEEEEEAFASADDYSASADESSVSADDSSASADESSANLNADEASPSNEGESARSDTPSFLESPEDSPAPVDELSIDSGGWADESAEQDVPAEDQSLFSMASPAEEPPSASDAEASFDVDTQDGAADGHGDDQEIAATQRHGWLLRHRVESADRAERADDAVEGGEQPEAPADEQGSEAAESFDEQPGYEEQQGLEQQEGYDPQEGFELQEGADAGSEQPSYESGEADQQDAYAQSAEGEESIDLATDEGWTGEPQEDAQGQAWFGEALSSTTPLSPADLGTLAALGLDPADGAAAQRMLACLVRVLNRRQAIDLDELAAEIRESQMAADEAAQTQGEEAAGEGDPEAVPPDDPANVQD